MSFRHHRSSWEERIDELDDAYDQTAEQLKKLLGRFAIEKGLNARLIKKEEAVS